MFEQSMVMPGPANRWSMATSLLLQASGVGVLLLIPLVWIEQLPAIPPLPPEVFAPRTLKPIKVFTEGAIRRRTTAPALTERRIFLPTLIPPRANVIRDPVELPEPGDIQVSAIGKGGPEGVPYSPFDGTQIINAPPPAKPVAVEKPAGPKTVTVTSLLQASKLVHQIKPAYPEIAKRANIQGVVRLHAVIAQDGTVQRLQVLSGHPLLVRAAVDAVTQWRYSPTLLGGNPVEVVTQIDVNFVLAR